MIKKLHIFQRCLIAIFITVFIIGASVPVDALAATAESKYHSAEGCYRYLKKNPKLQKYRDRWLRCIKKFLAVHRQAPRGPWASAGLFQAGQLYAKLYQHSYYAPDKKAALDLFDRIIEKYPKSSYRKKARDAKQKLLAVSPAAAPRISTSEKWYQKGEAAYKKLQNKPHLSRYFLKCGLFCNF